MVPLSTFADQDVLKVISDNQEKESEKRKIMEAKRTVVSAEEATKAEATKINATAADTSPDKYYDDNAGGVPNPKSNADSAAEGGNGAGGDPKGTPPVHDFFCDGCQVSILNFVNH